MEQSKQTPTINTYGILPVRYYKHYKGGTYFVNGFAVHEKTLKTVVLYTDGFTGIPFVRFAEEFVDEVEKGIKRFTLLEKR